MNAPYKDEISTMRNEMKEIQTENKAKIIEVKEQNASLRKVLEDHTSVFEVMQRKMAEYEKKFLTLEVEKSESCVLIRNFVGGEAKETRQTLRDSFQKLLQFLRLDNRIKVALAEKYKSILINFTPVTQIKDYPLP